MLAAGFSRRFGSDKRLARLQDGRQLLAASLALPGAMLSEMWVMVRDEDDRQRLGIAPHIQVGHCPPAREGMGSSLACGMDHIARSSGANAVAIFLGDMPFLKRETLQALFDAATAGNIVQPLFNGVPGHPVLFGRDFWPALERLQGDQGARAVIAEHARALVRLEVSDPGILFDIDTPELLEAAGSPTQTRPE